MDVRWNCSFCNAPFTDRCNSRSRYLLFLLPCQQGWLSVDQAQKTDRFTAQRKNQFLSGWVCAQTRPTHLTELLQTQSRSFSESQLSSLVLFLRAPSFQLKKMPLQSTLSGRSSSSSQAESTQWDGKTFEQLRQECLQKGVLFEDPDFPATDSSLYFSQSVPVQIQWKRPKVRSSDIISKIWGFTAQLEEAVRTVHPTDVIHLNEGQGKLHVTSSLGFTWK